MSSSPIRLCSEAQAWDEDIQLFKDKLAAFNEEQIGKNDFQPLNILLRDPDNRIKGGLSGWTVWQWFHIDSLWVDESYRLQGLGSSMIRKAEAEAVERKCTLVEVDTFSFQALDFYLKLGYQHFGTLDGIGGRHSRYYLSKKLPQT